MATIETHVAREGVAKPKLVFFTSAVSGRCRRVEGFLAQVLQRRRNHGAFRVHVIDCGDRPDLAERFKVAEVPTIVVVEGQHEQARLAQPKGCREIEEILGPWLR